MPAKRKKKADERRGGEIYWREIILSAERAMEEAKNILRYVND